MAGELHSTQPIGVELEVCGLPTYVASPSSDTPINGILVIIPDIFGWVFSKTRALADVYAAKGNFRVYVPDFTRGDIVPESVLDTMDQLHSPGGGWKAALRTPILISQLLSSKVVPFMYRNRASIITPRITAFFSSLRAEVSFPIGVVGLSWGGYYAVQLTRKGTSAGVEENDAAPFIDAAPFVDAAFVASPSQLSIPGDIRAVVAPLSIAVGNKDMVLNVKSIEQIRSLLVTPDQAGRHEVVVYDGAKHGDKVEKQLGLDAEDQAVKWFTKCFAAKAATLESDF